MKNFKLSLALSLAAKEKCKNKAILKKSLEEKIIPQKIVGFTDQHMQEMCKMAHKFLLDKRYSDAANSFLLLATLKDDAEYWMGFGMATQLMGDFETAINAYEIAASCHIESPFPYYYLAKAFFAIYERKRAYEALELAIFYAGDDPKYQELKAQALAAHRLLESQSDSS